MLFFASLLAECSLALQSDCLLGLCYMKETMQEHYLVSMNETKAYIKWKKKSHQKAEICGENFSIYCSLIHCFECFLIFHFKHVLREVGRKVLMEPVLTMDWGFQAQLYLWSPPLPINVTRSWCTNLARAGTQITISITGKVLLTFTVLEWLVVMHMIFDRNTGGKISKNKWLFEPNLRYYSYFKRFTGLGIYALHPWTPIA